jgi:lipopolysaccharide export system protein LptA
MKTTRAILLLIVTVAAPALCGGARAQDGPPAAPTEAASAVTPQKPEAAAPAQRLVITADGMVLETKSAPYSVTFDGNVAVTDPQFVMRCEKLVALFDHKSRKILRVDADSNIVVTQAQRVGKAQKATYTPEDGKIVLEGDPRIEGAEGVIVGKVITYFRDSEKVIVSGGTRMELAPEEISPVPAPQPAPQTP